MASISPILDAFAAGAAGGDPDRAEAIHREADSAVVVLDAKELLVRALTAASRSASKAAGEEPRESFLETGDDAFNELIAFKPLTAKAGPVLAKHAELLDLAVENLGPFHGGGKGQIKDPAGRVPVVDPVEPTPDEQEELARRAGLVAGLAGALLATDTLAEIRALNDGCPVCGAPVELSAVRAQELTGRPAEPDHDGVEFGLCELKHQLRRPKGTVGQWERVKRDELWAR